MINNWTLHKSIQLKKNPLMMTFCKCGKERDQSINSDLLGSQMAESAGGQSASCQQRRREDTRWGCVSRSLIRGGRTHASAASELQTISPVPADDVTTCCWQAVPHSLISCDVRPDLFPRQAAHFPTWKGGPGAYFLQFNCNVTLSHVYIMGRVLSLEWLFSWLHQSLCKA